MPHATNPASNSNPGYQPLGWAGPSDRQIAQYRAANTRPFENLLTAFITDTNDASKNVAPQKNSK
jgi:hypothetical protein